MIALVSKLWERRTDGWHLAIGVSAVLHLLVVAWLLLALEPEPPAIVRQPAQGKPVVAESIDPAWAEQELARLDQIKVDRAQQLETEREKVRQLEKEKARERTARKAAEKKKAESERLLAKSRKEEAARVARQKKIQQEQARQEQLKLKKKQEEQARQKASKQAAEKLAATKKAAEELKKKQAELAKQEAARKQAKRQAEAEAQRLRAEQQRAQDALQKQLASEQATLDAGVVQQYIAAIQSRVTGSWLRPATWSASASCDVAVKLVPGGEVIAAQVLGSCGSAVFDRSVEAAVVKASPLPVPDNPRLFNDNFRSFTFVFRNNE